MATSSFDRKIELDELSAKRLKKVLNTKKKVKIEDIDVEEQLKEGKEIMAVSLGVLPTIRGEEAKRLLSKLKETTLEKETLKKYAEEVENFFDIKE